MRAHYLLNSPPPPGPPFPKLIDKSDPEFAEALVQAIERQEAKPPTIEVIEIPGNSQEDYDAGFNDGLAQGMKLAAPAAAPDTQITQDLSDRLARVNRAHEEALQDNDALLIRIDKLRDALGNQTKEVEKRDTVILTLREDFTKLLAESQARNLRLFATYDDINDQAQAQIRQIVANIKNAITAGPDLAERRVIDDRVKGCLARVDKDLDAVGLAVEAGKIVPTGKATP